MSDYCHICSSELEPSEVHRYNDLPYCLGCYPLAEPKMTPTGFATEMQRLANDSDLDTEATHVRMDDLMCRVLKDLGYAVGVAIFQNTHKWYA